MSMCISQEFLGRPGPWKFFAGVPKSVGVRFSDVSGGGPTTCSQQRSRQRKVRRGRSDEVPDQ